MKPTSFFSAVQKILLVGAVLLGASELRAARSILDHERTEIDVFRAEIFGSNDLSKGALTLDNLYKFDYANAGIGTVIFRPAKQFRPVLIDQESPRTVGMWAPSEPSSFIRSDFDNWSPAFSSSRSLAFGDSNDPTGPEITAPVPEPATWFSGALALVAIAVARREWLRRLVARRA